MVIEVLALYKDKHNGLNRIGYRGTGCLVQDLPGLNFVVIAVHPAVDKDTKVSGVYEKDLLKSGIKK